MRVALELQPCFGERSGIGSYTFEIVKRLKSDDELEFRGNIFNFLGRNDLREITESTSIRTDICTLFPYSAYRMIWNCVPYSSLFPEKADLSLFFNYIVPPGIHGKVGSFIYDMTYLRCPETMDSGNLRRIRRGINYSVERSDIIFTISQFSKKEIVELLQIPGEKVHVVYSAPAPVNCPAAGELIGKRFNISRPYILYVGNIEPRKNLVQLIAAYEQLRNESELSHQLVLCGGSGWNNSEIYKRAESSPFRDDIIFTGYVSPEIRSGLYKNAAAFVYPSLYEGFGMPPLEAMLAGCPVVASDSSAIPEIVGDAALLTPPLDRSGIAEGLYKAITDNKLRDELIEKGAMRAKDFSWDKSAERITEICKDFLTR